jgi:hypothetical protein
MDIINDNEWSFNHRNVPHVFLCRLVIRQSNAIWNGSIETKTNWQDEKRQVETISWRAAIDTIKEVAKGTVACQTMLRDTN